MLLLADGRFPAGGHAHSAGVEAAVTDGRLRDETDLEAWLWGRAAAVGRVDAALAAMTAVQLAAASGDGMAGAQEALRALDAEGAARVPARPLRDVSRRLGRRLAIVGGRCWPGPAIAALEPALPAGAVAPVALGAVCVAAGADARDAAGLSLHHTLTTSAQAAVRLLGLDPFAVAALVAHVGAASGWVVDEAVDVAHRVIADLPARAEPLVEIASIAHASADTRMFAS